MRIVLAALSAAVALAAAAPVAAQGAITLPAPPDRPPPEACETIGPGEAGARIRLAETFRDDFDAFDAYAGPWTPHFDHNPYRDWRARTLTANAELQIYVDPRYKGSSQTPLGLDPFELGASVLRVTARPTPADAAPHLYGFPYISGLLSSRASLLQRYGYFEIRARLPAGRSLWPAFWMLSPGRWPPEIDVFERLSGRGSQIRVGLHWTEAGAHRASGCVLDLPDAFARFHRYGVLWRERAIDFYLDGAPVAWIESKPGLDRPMYMLANLAIAGSHADPLGPGSSSLEIDWIAAYAETDASAARCREPTC